MILSVVSTGCAVMKNIHGNENNLINNFSNDSLNERLEKQNLGTRGFYISKAEITISTHNGIEKILGNVKYNSSGSFLLSLRAKTGIEIARIFVTKDTLLVNDRINKKLYCGSSIYLKSKYGIPFSAIPIIFGDYVTGEKENRNIKNCIEGRVILDENIEGIRVNYIVDCKTGKSLKASLNDNIRKEKIEIAYSKLRKNDFGFLPGFMQINDLLRELTVIINIKKIESPWNGIIEFIPGKEYETVLLQ